MRLNTTLSMPSYSIPAQQRQDTAEIEKIVVSKKLSQVLLNSKQSKKLVSSVNLVT